jgi:hypothetical protein
MEWVRNEARVLGRGGGTYEGKILGQRRGLKNPWAGEEDGFLVHSQNGLNGLILNWCIGGCWFTPAQKKGHTLDASQSLMSSSTRTFGCRCMCVSQNVFTSWSTCLEEPFLFLVCYGHCFLWRTIHYNTIPGPLESTNILKLTYFIIQHTQAQLLLRGDMGNCRGIQFSWISNIFQHVMN